MDGVIARVSAMTAFTESVRETAAALNTRGTATRGAVPASRPRSRRTDHGPSAAAIKNANTALIIAFARGMQWEIAVPGQDQLLGYLRAMEKDLVADSASLRNRVKIALLNEFENYPQLLGAAQCMQFAGVFILETIELRFGGGLRDVRIRANTDRWTRRKHALGAPTQVGVFTRHLLDAIETQGRIEFV
jgi:hypothetical protein